MGCGASTARQQQDRHALLGESINNLGQEPFVSATGPNNNTTTGIKTSETALPPVTQNNPSISPAGVVDQSSDTGKQHHHHHQQQQQQHSQQQQHQAQSQQQQSSTSSPVRRSSGGGGGGVPVVATSNSGTPTSKTKKREVYKPPSSAIKNIKKIQRSDKSPTKKKSNYVPPSPITATVPVVEIDTAKGASEQLLPSTPQLDHQTPSSPTASSSRNRNSSSNTSGGGRDIQTSPQHEITQPNSININHNTKSHDKIKDSNNNRPSSKGGGGGKVEDGSLGSLDFIDQSSFDDFAGTAAGNNSSREGQGQGASGDDSRLKVEDDDDFALVIEDEIEEIPKSWLQDPDMPIKTKAITSLNAPPSRDSSKRSILAPDETPEPSSESGMRFDELYRLKGVLGTGAFSTVREGFHRSNTEVSYAVKCINRKKLSEEDEAALLDEVAILKEMKHVHIIRLYDFFVEPSTYYLVMERMRGGELFDRIVAKAYYNEKEARDTCKILLEAVRYCHKNHVAHRDLKPENLLLLSDDDDTSVKIADFGFAKKVYKPNSLKTQCGTPGYVAPEILEGTPYDERADMWSVGVILYILLGGYPPFIESTQRDLFRKIRKGDYEFHEEYWGTVSTEAKDLISSLLTVDAKMRLTAVNALTNAWILGDDAKLAAKDLGTNLDKLRNFNAKRKFRAAVSTVMAVKRLETLSSSFFGKLKE